MRHFFGDQLDLHAGGIDLVFPHHVNEIAQSEAVTGKQMAQHWVHNGFVNVNDEKMSKSKGNFLTLRGTFQNSLDVRAFRYLVVSSQYRMALNFSPEALAAARKGNTYSQCVRVCFASTVRTTCTSFSPAHTVCV